MRNKKLTFVLTGLMALGIMLVSAPAGFANEDPPPTGEIVEPKLWAVIVLDCGAEKVATMRVKRIVDCEVEVQAEVMAWPGACPADEDAPVNWEFEDLVLFDINPGASSSTKHPIITKVKNFKKEDGKNVYSFDAELMFWQP